MRAFVWLTTPCLLSQYNHRSTSSADTSALSILPLFVRSRLQVRPFVLFRSFKHKSDISNPDLSHLSHLSIHQETFYRDGPHKRSANPDCDCRVCCGHSPGVLNPLPRNERLPRGKRAKGDEPRTETVYARVPTQAYELDGEGRECR
ncbi:uncharacterized protein BDW70DRAFT_9520 [Aspergillus foveolatus]|uniref:uncharacterized protein n=1 Tax=Aspergillus foveolatus TaxID=210207 RepID=UPI003CCDA71B